MKSAACKHSNRRHLPFRDRAEAGHLLASTVCFELGTENAVVIALPRGGVPVAAELARHLGLPLDVLPVRKVGLPWQPELAVAAVASGGVEILDHELVVQLRLPQEKVEHWVSDKRRELEAYESSIRVRHRALSMEGRVVILVDDGAATGSSMLAAIESARRQHARLVIVAVPVSSPEAASEISRAADKFITLASPDHFLAVGEWYRSFAQVSDETVERLLAECAGSFGKYAPLGAAGRK